MDLSTVIINFQTPELLQTAVGSFKKEYPEAKLLIIDNGSRDNSPEVIRGMVKDLQNTKAVYLPENIYHGPAMDLAIRGYVDTGFVLFLDSDTETKKGGFLEKMLAGIQSNDRVYGVGEFTIVNKRGFKAEEGITILQTPYMMLRTDEYKKLSPFIHHGQPTLFNFKEAAEKGLSLSEFKISAYIDHKWRGTAEKFGYGLGLKGKWDFFLNKLGI